MGFGKYTPGLLKLTWRSENLSSIWILWFYSHNSVNDLWNRVVDFVLLNVQSRLADPDAVTSHPPVQLLSRR